MNSNDEVVIDWVDETDQVIGPISRKNIYRENASFRTSHIFLFNSKGQLLLQKISEKKERYPGRYGSSVAGYVLSGESYEQAAKRKLMDELGVSNKEAKIKLVGKTFMEDMGRRKFVSLFLTTYDNELKPDSEQMDEVKFFDPKEITKMREKDANVFTPTFLHVLDYYLNK